MVNMNLLGKPDDSKLHMISNFKNSILNIQKMGVSQQRAPLTPATAKGKQALSPCPVSNKKSLLQKRSPTNEKTLLPKTPEKYASTKRILFRRRERMNDKNLILIYFEGVLGDTQQLYNYFRVRSGAFSGLRKLYAWS